MLERWSFLSSRQYYVVIGANINNRKTLMEQLHVDKGNEGFFVWFKYMFMDDLQMCGLQHFLGKTVHSS